MKTESAPREYYLSDQGFYVGSHETRLFHGIHVIEYQALTDLQSKLDAAKTALNNIQNANGSPYDEDYVTTEARETLAKIGEK